MDWSLTLVSTIEDGALVGVEEYFDRSDALTAVKLEN